MEDNVFVGATINLLTLPEEIRCAIIKSRSFSMRDISNVMLTSTVLWRDFQRCLTYLHADPDEDITAISPLILQTLPALVSVGYPILIGTEEEYTIVAEHPNLVEGVFDLASFYRENNLDLISQLLINFLAHKQDLTNSNLIFIFPNWEIKIKGNSLCITSKGFLINNLGGSLDPFITFINNRVPLLKYKGPLPPPLNQVEEAAFFILDNSSLILPPPHSGLAAGWLGSYLLQFPQLRRFGLYATTFKAARARSNYDPILDLEGFSFPKITGYENAITLGRTLFQFHRIFPSVLDPLVQLPHFPIRREQWIEYTNILKQGMQYFSTYRITNLHYANELSSIGIPAIYEPETRFVATFCA